MEHVECLHAWEGRLRALAVDEFLFGGEADGAERRLLQVIDAVGVVGEVVGEQGLREREVEVLLRVFQQVDEAGHDGCGVGVAEAESAVAEVVAGRGPGGWGCERRAG